MTHSHAQGFYPFYQLLATTPRTFPRERKFFTIQNYFSSFTPNISPYRIKIHRPHYFIQNSFSSNSIQSKYHSLSLTSPIWITQTILSSTMALSVSDLPAMYTLLANSLSGDDSLRKPAEATLSQSENRPGFCSCLMVLVYSNHFHIISCVFRVLGSIVSRVLEGNFLLFELTQEVITAKDLAAQADVRLMASVYFKNSVNRYWRNRRDSS